MIPSAAVRWRLWEVEYFVISTPDTDWVENPRVYLRCLMQVGLSYALTLTKFVQSRDQSSIEPCRGEIRVRKSGKASVTIQRGIHAT